MRMNVDESKNINQGLSTQLMHLFLHTCSEAPSLNKTMNLYAFPSNLSKMTVLMMRYKLPQHIKTMKDSSPRKKRLYILFKIMRQKH